MWQYEKKLQYPVKIANPNPALAKVIISQLGGADFKKLYIKMSCLVSFKTALILLCYYSLLLTITISNINLLYLKQILSWMRLN